MTYELAPRSGGWVYIVTPDDVLWLSRAVEFEGQPQEQVARALVNLFVWARERSKVVGESLERTVRAYAQPVNPDWENRGSAAQVARRLEARTRTAFSLGTEAAVHRALSSDWASDVTDYAASSVDASGKGYVRRSRGDRRTNAMWTREPGWPGYVAREVVGMSELVSRIRQKARSLPAEESRMVERALQRLGAVVGADWGLLDGVRVIRPGEPGYEEARAQEAARGKVEWDLAAVNSLEQLYDAVADRVSELAEKAKRAAKGALSSATPWLLVAAVVTVFVVAGERRR